ncbi:hypothetical protein PQO03_06620 [Lentisphaera profundi]|uniref:Uncharacterized protein n=1 Tax=Lentisphaera profundi TaxID=1658616 RepID=A0ABY7VNX4_9BACT|nr:hypothetical protein [Lentisphaera profundi]WDE95389.1 hypothetical protein PQO03_06620 [Lentisphaera profundi]
MKYLLLFIMMSFNLVAEGGLAPYKKAKHTVVKVLAKNSSIYKMSQKLAIEKHLKALELWKEIAVEDSHFRMMLAQRNELAGNKEKEALKRFYLIENELEYYLINEVKNDSRFSESYDQWAKAQAKLNDFRLSKIKGSDHQDLLEAYKIMDTFRASEL